MFDSLKLTLDMEENNKLPFLGVLVERSINMWRTSVYRKPTASDRYMQFRSNHPVHVKRGLVIGVLLRMPNHCAVTIRYSTMS